MEACKAPRSTKQTFAMQNPKPPLYETIPLEGMQLIEASAGTGKTFNMVEVYKRLLREQQDASIERILVMTFTEAATEDMRRKVREALHKAIRHQGVQDQARIEALKKAIDRVGEAPISTIHAFSKKATEELAIESGALFDRGSLVEDEEVFREVCLDYWRRNTIGGRRPEQAVQSFMDCWKSPGSLFEDMGTLLLKPYAKPEGLTMTEVIGLAQEAQQLWKSQRQSLQNGLEAVEASDGLKKNGMLAKRIADVKGVSPLLDALEAALFCDIGGIPLLPEWLMLLTPEKIQNQIKKEALKTFTAHETPLVRTLTELARCGKAAILTHAHAWIRQRASALKKERRLFSYMDMIEELHSALQRDLDGHLSSRLAALWPYVLVDEFQDTDPMQYEILTAMLTKAQNRALFMIGDPKQAIYSFRGADVFAYLKARKEAWRHEKASKEGRELTTNYRSSPKLIEALHQLFGGEPNPFILEGDWQIAYEPVAPADRNMGIGMVKVQPDKTWTDAPALTIWKLEPKEQEAYLTTQKARKALIGACVAQIITLLEGTTLQIVEHSEDPGRPGPQEPRRIVPGDIAVLVPSNKEASIVQRELGKRGVGSVCLHDQSVFQTHEAKEVLRLLKAVDRPTDERAVRSALFSVLLGKTLKDFASYPEWNASETFGLPSESDLFRMKAFETQRDLFKEAKQRWNKAGVLAMMLPFLQESAPAILAMDDGERRMGNYIQLAELLMEAEGSSFGAKGLIRTLERAMEDGGESSQIRMESDEALVRISTIHKAKGLEYGIVFLPTAPLIGQNTKKPPGCAPYVYHDEALGEARIAFKEDPISKAQAIKEHRAEGVRLLYVALTRAKYALYMGYGPIRLAQNGALAWMLHRGEDGTHALPEAWASPNSKPPEWFTTASVGKTLAKLEQASLGGIAVVPPPVMAAPGSPQGESDASAQPKTPRKPLPKRPRLWITTSYSSLRGKKQALIHEAGSEDEDTDSEVAAEASLLPRGKDFGNVFHDFMEKADFQDLARPEALYDPELLKNVQERLSRWPLRTPAEEHKRAQEFLKCAQRTVCEPLRGLEAALQGIPKDQQAREMEFFFSLNSKGSLEDLSRILREGKEPRPLGAEGRLQGLMTGFIDVAFEQGGRYFVLDYKTNDLGSSQEGYTKEEVNAAMEAHDYDLQATIYLVALHRHLKAHLKGYIPEHHLGGVFYLFVRGLDGSGESGVFAQNARYDTLLKIDTLLDQDGTA